MVPGQVIALQNFRQFRDLFFPVGHLFEMMGGQLNIDKADHTETHLLSIQKSRVFVNEARFFKTLNPRMNSRRRKIDLPAQIRVADPTIGLQNL